jgi:hypothetical protein
MPSLSNPGRWRGRDVPTEVDILDQDNDVDIVSTTKTIKTFNQTIQIPLRGSEFCTDSVLSIVLSRSAIANVFEC